MQGATSTQPAAIHLVGSMPLASTEEVFRTVCGLVGPRLKRLPDGETDSGRKHYVGYQRAQFYEHPLLEAGEPDPETALPTAVMRPRPGVAPADIAFGLLGYAVAARESYATFERLQQEGVIPPGVLFQVCLPLPMDAVCVFIAPDAQAAVEPGYEAAMFRELDAILAALPHERLAIQLDLCGLVWMWEGWVKADPALGDLEPALIERAARLSARVPDDVEMGYHLCYGDWSHKHLREPRDTANLTTIANRLAAAVARPIQWLHVPVPIERDDPAYFAPLRDLRLHPETELYLGLVHYRDGAEGARRRLAVARQVVARPFGVATECGMGRRPPERGGAPDTFCELLRVHVAAAEAGA
jgi:hypothetical protein